MATTKSKNKGFFGILPRWLYKDYPYANPLWLHVVQSNGIDVNPNFNISVNKLNKTSKNTAYNQFLNKGRSGASFTIDVMLKKAERWDIALLKKTEPINYVVHKPYIRRQLQYWIDNMIVMYVVTDAIDIPNGTYIIKDNPSRKQNYHDYSIWTLEFVKYNALNTVKYKNNNTAIKTAINKANKARKAKAAAAKKAAKKSTKTTKKASSKNKKLSKCSLSVLVYSKNKKVVTCVKYMQEVLYKKGFLTKNQVDGWWGNVTTGAVKKFQQKYQKSYKLKVTGKMDKNTLNCMCNV